MHVELVKTTTSDGVRLDGALQRAGRAADNATTVLCLHGAGANFYSGGLFEHLAPRMADAGFQVLRVNTRGRDGYYAGRTAAGAKRLGAAYETVSDCVLDIAAWLAWLERHGAARVVLMGHSLGAIKAVYAAATAPDSRVTAVCTLSPPRLSRSAFEWSPQGATFKSLLQEAETHVRAGQGLAVMESTFPFPMLITAAAFIDKYGSEKYNIVELSKALTTPAAFIFGQMELEHGGVAFAGVPEAISAVHPQPAALSMHVVDGADHFYVGCYDALTSAVLTSLGSLD